MTLKLKTNRDDSRHLSMSMSLDGGETWGDQRVCGESWCRGDCGLPALVLIDEGRGLAYKAYSAMTACGPVWQPFRVQWTGECLPTPFVGDIDVMTKMMWW